MKILSIILLLALIAVSACRRHTPGSEQRFDLKGKVVAVEVDKHLVTVAHDEVKGFMPAMTMPFMLPDESALQFLTVGDEISATLVVDRAQSWLENVAITRESPNASGTTGITEAKEGDEVPDYRLINQDGKEIRLHNFHGKALLLTFIYTRCPLPEYCNLMSTNFRRLIVNCKRILMHIQEPIF